jgi:hypothetical protein
MSEWLYCEECEGWRNCHLVRHDSIECAECGANVGTWTMAYTPSHTITKRAERLAPRTPRIDMFTGSCALCEHTTGKGSDQAIIERQIQEHVYYTHIQR